MVPDEWIEHRRPGDRELLGWVRPEVDQFVAVDRLGRDLTGPVDWLAAEEALDGRGIAWLSGLWQLTHDGKVLRVRVIDVRPDAVVVATDDHGSIDVPSTRHTLPFPAPAELRPFEGDPFLLAGPLD
ncbi:hypothetical protein [Cellulomonas composti]|uniref:Uncharacterized protein n=1 Tax=Cellulomonas composti TaxID=266130 RepID=A0A511JAJ5_9CELL|nr:hypothetical protein [Cellulomonas composti]GEL95021.1 hypothetical protein CCO02nite_16790 [Cellulomonas composti]